MVATLFLLYCFLSIPSAMSLSAKLDRARSFRLEDMPPYDPAYYDDYWSKVDWVSHSDMDANRPILVEGPTDSYVVRNRPTTIGCKALNAKKIRFKCNGLWVDNKPQGTNEGTDPNSGLPFLESTLPIYRQEVESYAGLDGFHCECYASGTDDSLAVRSDRAKVIVAFLRKHFYSTPASDSKPIGSTIQMQCLPPDGDPRPEIFWLKDGVELNRGADPNVILANDGSLIISAARVSDSGNYTCGARNLASKRLTETAPLRIYVDGGWSEWSSWSGSCDVDCDRLASRMRQNRRRGDLVPKMQRQRLCNAPAPKNGGRECRGTEREQIDCDLNCPVDGDWTQWTQWSQCSAECHRFRTRDCANPFPRNGGRPCKGADLETKNCTNGYCRGPPGTGVTPKETASSWETNLALISGISVAFMLFVIVSALIIWLLCRRSKCCKSEKENDMYYASNNGHLRTVIGMQPDLTQNALLAPDISSLKRPPPALSSFSLKSGSTGYGSRPPTKDNLRQMGTLAGSKTALIEGSSSGHSSHPPSIDSAEKQRCLSRNSDDNYATLYDYCEEERQNQRNSILSSAFPSHIEVDSLSHARFDYRGGELSLPHCGICLTVPEGALEKHQCEEMYIAVCRDLADRPRLSDKETLLSPVIWCGPPGLALRKPVIVSFPHCAQPLHMNSWMLSLWLNEGLPDDSTDWERVATLGAEDINTPVFCQLEMDSVHVMSDSLCRMALVGQGRPGQPAPVKRMKLAAFAPLYPSTLDYSIRVYCVEDTDASVQGIIEEEERLGGYMVADTRDLNCQEGGDLCCCLEEVSAGWQVKPGANYQEIPATHLWSASGGGLHCSFSLELLENVSSGSNLSARIVVYQKGASGSRQILQVNTAVQCSELRAPPRSESAAQTIVSSCGSSLRHTVSTSSQQSFKLPLTVKRALARVLDPPTETENDWRMLARKLDADRFILYFGYRSSPTEHILDLWEAIDHSSTAIMQLLQTLRNMGRLDAAQIVENFLSQHPVAL